MVDLDAPIIPGASAGGIALGSRIQDVLADTGDYFTVKRFPPLDRPIPDWYARLDSPPSSTVYTSAAIDLWVKDGKVHQIGVHDGYRGKLRGVIGVGSTLAELAVQVGVWDEDDDGELVVLGLPGLCFDVDALLRGTPDPGLEYAPIAWLFVFPVDESVPVSQPVYSVGR